MPQKQITKFSECLTCGKRFAYRVPAFMASTVRKYCDACACDNKAASDLKAQEAMAKWHGTLTEGYNEAAWNFPREFMIAPFKCMENADDEITFCRKWAVQAATAYMRPLLLWGPTGVGKTRLACGTAQAFATAHLKARYNSPTAFASYTPEHDRARGLGKSISFFSATDIVSDYRNAIKEGIPERIAVFKYKNPALLMIDDLGAEMLTEYTSTNLHHIIDTRERDQRLLIITTNLGIDAFEARYGSRLFSRCWSGDVMEVKGKDRRLFSGEGFRLKTQEKGDKE